MPRPRRLEVEHTGLDGVRAVTVFTDAVARLVDHEADHLYGPIYAALCARASGRSASPSTRAPAPPGPTLPDLRPPPSRPPTAITRCACRKVRPRR
ncbi:hypothetical protein [Actinomadura citrea]|uniref:hypothetical protein n=1 Tax=Actinomadura citrea TaxID=46158 RepID=UPI0039A56DB0